MHHHTFLFRTYTFSALYRNNRQAPAVETHTDHPSVFTADNAASEDAVLTVAEVKKMSYL